MVKICSECKREFGKFEGMRIVFDSCPDCGGKVVPKDTGASDMEYATVFVADGMQEAEEAKKRLDENKIPYVTRGDWQLQNSYIDFLVREDKTEDARALLKDIIDAEAIPDETREPGPEEGEEAPQMSVAPKAAFDQGQTDDEGSNKVVILIIAFAIFAFLVILLNYLVKK